MRQLNSSVLNRRRINDGDDAAHAPCSRAHIDVAATIIHVRNIYLGRDAKS
jgi:hypothetical protein